MRISAVSELFILRDDSDQLAIRQRACGITAATQTLLLLPILIAVVGPSAMIAAQALAEPATRDRLAASPLNTAGALVGVAIWFAMFAIPAFHALRRIGWSRDVELDRDTVRICDRTLFGTRRLQLPLREFEGISHHVRTNLSGTRHELVLVHHDRSSSLLLQMSDSISQDATEANARRFQLPVLPAGALFLNRPRRTFCFARLFPAMKPQQA
ncbi:MAG: hypothetical protein APF80_14870 [Alphaproteobacteria bacterium BRH_c36]|nr:MAG: hypothetical protein APF80_14870 [Alphaproteobacteria bacterium BRH_c36]